jgi:predicted dehydrogenase
MMTSPLKFGIAGFGKFAARSIAPAFQQVPDARLIAVQNRSAERALENAARAGVQHGFGSVADMVRHPDIDAVYIVSANAAHGPDTIAAAEAGKHVIVEKPMATSVAEAESMIMACRVNGVRLMVGHMIRFSPYVLRIREIVRSAMLGTLRFARAEFVYDARLSERTWLVDRPLAGGGPVFDVGVHCIDTLRFVLQDEVVETRGVLAPRPTDERTEETATLSLRFARGTVASVICSYQSPIRRRMLELVGDEGILTAPDFTAGDITGNLGLAIGRDSQEIKSRTEMIPVPNLYAAEISHFCRSILQGTSLETPGENGLANQRVLEAAFMPA